MTNPTLEQVEAARAEYDRSEDMCAALVAAAELTGEIARPGHDDSYRRERAEQATEEEPAQSRPPFLLSQSRVNESESDPENSEGNNAGHASTIRGAAPQEPTSERCGDCGDKLDYVAGLDGNGWSPHCWRCWYREHPDEHQVHEAKLPYVTRVTLAGRTGARSAEHWDYAGVELLVQDEGRTLKVLPLADSTYRRNEGESE